MPTNDAPPRPGTHPIGFLSHDGTDGPDRLPTLAEFADVTRERCREKLAAGRLKALAADVFAAFGDAARPVLARHFLAEAADGAVRSGIEEEVDADWIAIVAALDIAGKEYPLPADTRVDATTGCVVVTPILHA